MSNERETEIFVKVCSMFAVVVGPFCIGGFIYTIFRDLNNGRLSPENKVFFLEAAFALILLCWGWIWAFKRCRDEYGWFSKNKSP